MASSITLCKFEIVDSRPTIRFFDFNPDKKVQFWNRDEQSVEHKILSVKQTIRRDWPYGVEFFTLQVGNRQFERTIIRYHGHDVVFTGNHVEFRTDIGAQGTVEYNQDTQTVEMFIIRNGVPEHFA